jgi:hypothetical protein
MEIGGDLLSTGRIVLKLCLCARTDADVPQKFFGCYEEPVSLVIDVIYVCTLHLWLIKGTNQKHSVLLSLYQQSKAVFVKCMQESFGGRTLDSLENINYACSHAWKLPAVCPFELLPRL